MVMLWLLGCGYPLQTDDTAYGEVDEACIDEREPNDFEEDLEYHTLGVFTPGREVSICGRLSTVSMDGEGQITGDRDYFVIETLDAVTLDVELEIYDGVMWVPGTESVGYDGWMSVRIDETTAQLIAVSAFEGSGRDYRLAIRAR